MLGANEPYSTLPFFWTQQYGKTLRYVGYAPRTDNIVFHGSPEDQSFTAYFLSSASDDAKVNAVASFNKDPQAVSALELMRRNLLPSAKTIRSQKDGIDLQKILELQTV